MTNWYSERMVACGSINVTNTDVKNVQKADDGIIRHVVMVND